LKQGFSQLRRIAWLLTIVRAREATRLADCVGVSFDFSLCAREGTGIQEVRAKEAWLDDSSVDTKRLEFGVKRVHGELQKLPMVAQFGALILWPVMRDFLVLMIHLIVIVVRLGKPGGLRSVVAESVLVRHQLLMLNRGRKRAPNLRIADRLISGLCTLLIRPSRLLRSAVVLKPVTLLHLHQILKKRKYRLLFSPKRRHRPGPKGPLSR
jgi:hypothetical protein